LLALAGGGLVVAAIAGSLLDGNRGARPGRAARLAACGAGLLAASVLADSAMEHYRGSYKKRAMFVAPVAAAVTLATAIATALSGRFSACKAALFGGAMATGLFGTGFHIRNILRRPGGLSFNNLFYRAPFGAPAALVLAGAAGIGAVAADRAGQRGPFFDSGQREGVGRCLGALTAAGLFGLTAEVGLLHFRGAFHNKLMYAPIIGVPLTGAALLAAVVDPTPARRRLAREALETTAALGLIGTGLHTYGVSRNMGGFWNWTQNLFQGPPIAAPPSLAGIALIGFSALDLLGRQKETVGLLGRQKEAIGLLGRLKEKVFRD
jgi:hypothetical protein